MATDYDQRLWPETMSTRLWPETLAREYEQRVEIRDPESQFVDQRRLFGRGKRARSRRWCAALTSRDNVPRTSGCEATALMDALPGSCDPDADCEQHCG